MEEEGLNLKKSSYKKVQKDSGQEEKYKTILEGKGGLQFIIKSSEPIDLPAERLKVMIEESELDKDKALEKLNEVLG